MHQYVQIEKKRQVIMLLDDHSPLLNSVRTVENLIRSSLGFDVLVSTSKVKKSQYGRKFFEFQCARYVLNEETRHYEPWTIQSDHTACPTLEASARPDRRGV